jgi:flagellar protein FlgJ
MMDVSSIDKISGPNPPPDIRAKNEKLREACSDFEALFLDRMFQSMRKTLPGDAIFGGSHQKEIYESLYYEEMSKKISRGKGMGIGEALYRQLEGKQ